jgi:hypothetical protein
MSKPSDVKEEEGLIYEQHIGFSAACCYGPRRPQMNGV